MPDLYQFRRHFEPLFLPGHTVRIHKADGIRDLLIRAVGALPLHRHDFGAFTGITALTAQECTHLEMQDGDLAEYRFIPQDNFEVELTHPTTTTRQFVTRNRGTTQGTTWRIPPWINDPTLPAAMRDYFWAASEFFVWEQETPRFDLYPILSGAGSLQGYLEFSGWRYSAYTFEKAREAGVLKSPEKGGPERGMFDLWVNSWPSG